MALALVAVLLAGGAAAGGATWHLRLWEDEPLRTWSLQRRAACAGDVAGWFAYVDRSEIEARAVTTAKRNAWAKYNTLPANQRKVMTTDMVEGIATAASKRAMEEAFKEWETDLARGEGSFLCKLELASSAASSVTFKRVSGKTSTWFYAHDATADRWRLSEVTSAD